MSKPIKISIITPSFNQGNFIEQTIQSVLSQNYPNLEYIIIDGGSTDNSVEIIKKYESKIKYWVSEKDKGQSHAINKGFKIATGDIMAWLNSDDLYLPNTFKTVLEIFSQNPNVDLVYGDVINFYPDGKEKYYKVKEFEPIGFLTRISIHQPSVFWRRKLQNQVGWLDEQLHYTMDYDLWMRIFFEFNTLKINEPLAKFRIHSSAKTVNNPKEMYLEYRKVLSRFFNSLNTDSFVNLLIFFSVYDNPNDIKYNISNTAFSLTHALQSYIFQSGVQEYTFGSRIKANRIFLYLLKSKFWMHSILYLVKNNSIRFVK